MNITIERDALRNAMTAIDKIVKRSETVPVLGCVKLEARGSRLTITGTDTGLWATATLNVDVDEPGALVVDAAALSRAANAAAAGSQIALVAKDGHALGRAGAARFRLPLWPVADFPPNKDLSARTQFDIGGADLKSLISRCAHAMGVDDGRIYLNGLHLMITHADNGTPQLRAVATDGHRLVRMEIPVDEATSDAFDILPNGIIVPRQLVGNLQRLLKDEDIVTIRLDDSLMEITQGDLSIVSKLLDAQYPDIDKMIPQNNGRIATLDRQAFLDLATRIGAFADEAKHKSLRLKFEGATLEMSAGGFVSSANASAADEMSIAGFADPLEIGFQVKYLREAIDNGAGTEMTMSFGTPKTAVFVTFPQDSRLRTVLMPRNLEGAGQ